VAPDAPRPRVAAAAVTGELEIFLSLTGAIDLDAERERLTKELGKVDVAARGVQAKLHNEDFRKRAPANVVAAEEDRLRVLMEARARLEQNLTILKGDPS
jgi:valyl-tRNA synthetase